LHSVFVRREYSSGLSALHFWQTFTPNTVRITLSRSRESQCSHVGCLLRSRPIAAISPKLSQPHGPSLTAG